MQQTQKCRQNTTICVRTEICKKWVILVCFSVLCNKTHNCKQNTLFA
ncbi:hypothetical protein E2C01_072581 [Portunus trituberculatus]|uniref:Uncharacterized protein n=1 Tax=Portunus trituberculatus TaxID=210409 RepID=A0A5B7I732_PORTR|nr:hypothetical protein [Portunus trituberculatus]